MSGNTSLLEQVGDSDIRADLSASLLPYAKAVMTLGADKYANENDDLYRIFFKKISAQAIANHLSIHMVTSAIPIAMSYRRGVLPNLKDVPRNNRVGPSPSYQIQGVYLHVGRIGSDGSIDLVRGGYVGSGTGKQMKSHGDIRGLVGVARRVLAEHGSPNYRQLQLKTKGGANRPEIPHYSGYEADDTHERHHYLLLAYITLDDDLQGLIEGLNINDVRVSQLVVQVWEATLIAWLGAFAGHEIATRLPPGTTIPRYPIQRKNRSRGLEVMLLTSEVATERGSLGGHAAKATFELEGASSLTGFMHARGINVPKMGALAKAENDWDKLWKTWTSGEAVQVSLS